MYLKWEQNEACNDAKKLPYKNMISQWFFFYTPRLEQE